MKNAKVNAIVFAQAKDSTKAVVANKYVAYALYAQNKALVEALGGEIIKGVDGFRAEFKTAKNAKAFIAQAICEMSAKDYNKARKTEPKAKVEKKATIPAPAKGTKKAKTNGEFKFTTVTDANGNKFTVPTSALEAVKATAPKKPTSTKGKKDKPTIAPKSTKKAEKVAKKSKGNCAVDFSKLAGKGRAANRDAAALMRKAGLVDGTSAEYKAVWAEWCKVR